MKLVVLAALLAACGGRAATSPTTRDAAKPAGKPLYDRIGGMDAIDAIVKDFVEVRIARDDRIRDRFTNVDLRHFQAMLADQLCEVSGGPCKYDGKHMRDVHAGMALGDAEFRVFLDDLRLALGALPAREQDELLERLATFKEQIVQPQ
jgi:hemoglobin